MVYAPLFGRSLISARFRLISTRVSAHCQAILFNGRIRLSISKVNRTYELSGITQVTPFSSYEKHSTGPSTYWLWVHTYSKLLSYKSVLTVRSYRSQSNEIYTYRRVSRGSLPRVRWYGLLYLWTVEYKRAKSAERPWTSCHIIRCDHKCTNNYPWWYW